MSHHRYDTVIHLGQIASFDSFWYTLRVEDKGRKGAKNALPSKNNSQKLQIFTER